MAEETLTARMRAVGDRSTARAFRRVARAVDEVGDQSVQAAAQSGVFARALTFLGTKMGAVIILGGLMTLTLGPPMLAAIALLTAALVALGGVIVGTFILGLGAILLFKKQADIAGTAAWKLKKQFEGMRETFMRAVTPGANAVLNGLTRALEILEPVLGTMRPAFTAFGKAIGQAMKVAATGLAAVGPDFRYFLVSAAELLPMAAQAVGPFFKALVTLGQAGLPILRQLIIWLVAFSRWLAPAIENAANWERRTQTLQTVLGVFAQVCVYLGNLLANLGTILYQLYIAAEPVLKIVGAGLLVAARLLAGAIDWLSRNMKTLAPYIVAVAVAFGLLYGIIALVNIVGTVLGLLLGNIWILAIAAVVVAIVYLYKHWGWFHRAVDNTVNFILHKLVPALKSVWEWIKTAFGNAVDFVKPKIEWLIDKIKWLVDKAGTVADIVGKVKGGGVPFVPGIAGGGTLTRGGMAVVGERGPELVRLPRGAHVTPNHQLGGGGGGGDTWIAATFVTPDGEVLARQTVKAMRRKQSVR